MPSFVCFFFFFCQWCGLPWHQTQPQLCAFVGEGCQLRHFRLTADKKIIKYGPVAEGAHVPDILPNSSTPCFLVFLSDGSGGKQRLSPHSFLDRVFA